MADSHTYWLISAPKTREDTFNTLNKKTSDEQNYSSNNKFEVPDLKVGTLNSLMTLSDDLNKIDALAENVTKKIASQLFDLLDNDSHKGDKYESLAVNNTSIDNYLKFFHWDEAKYSTMSSLASLTEMISSQMSKLDEELKIKASDYNSLLQTMNAENRKLGGTWLTKDLTDVVKASHITESEYLDTVFVAVPKYAYKEWNATYESLTSFVIPRSSELIVEDNDYGIFKVVLFKKVIEDFKNMAREKKFIVRDFKFDSSKNASSDRKKLELEKQKQTKALIRWCRTYFSEAFIAWIHLKAIRVFVESVLRYGLPTNFQAMLLLPHKGKAKKLRKVLNDLYGYLSSKSVFNAKDEEGSEDFFPYVYLEINLDFKSK